MDAFVEEAPDIVEHLDAEQGDFSGATLPIPACPTRWSSVTASLTIPSTVSTQHAES